MEVDLVKADLVCAPQFEQNVMQLSFTPLNTEFVLTSDVLFLNMINLIT